MLTVAEQTVEKCCQELKERLSSFITEKEIIKGEEQAITNQSIMQILVDVFMPKWTRMRFRLLENEKDFVIEIYDSHGKQEMQSVKIRFKYEFDWKIGSWEEAKSVPTKEERQKLFSYWQENGYSTADIAEHFGANRGTVTRWPKSVCRNLANKRQHYEEINHPANVISLLRKAGMKSVSDEFISQICKCSFRIAASAQRRTLVSEGPFYKIDYERAIEYVNWIIYKLSIFSKSLGSGELDHHDRLIGRTVYASTGIRVTNKRSYNPIKQWYTPSINQENRKDAIIFLNNVLEKLNQKRKELAA